jgi:putative ABC transport system permease protein
MELKLKSGRNISSAFPSDEKHGALVNEAFVKAAGLKTPIGTQLRTSDYYDKEIRTIVGVVEDYHSGSLHKPIKPIVMIVCNWYSTDIWIKIEKNKQAQAIAAIETAYKKAMPGSFFKYSFLDELNEKEYLQEQPGNRVQYFSEKSYQDLCIDIDHLILH